MKKLCYLFLIIHGSLFSQSLFDFESGSLHEWLQDPEDHWEISFDNPVEGNASLHHAYDNAFPGIDFIAKDMNYTDPQKEMIFSFRVKHAYNPSSGNSWQVFFLTEHYSAHETGTGFFYGVNFNCSDDLLKLWQFTQTDPVVICSTNLNYQEVIGTEASPLFEICRNPGGTWKVRCSVSGNADSLILLGEGTEKSFPPGRYFGIRYSYSSAQDRKLWIDDVSIEGKFFEDTLAPVLEELKFIGLKCIQLKFSEAIEITTTSKIKCESNIIDSLAISGEMITLYYKKNFPNRKIQKMEISNLIDKSGNFILDTLVIFQQDLAEFGDIVINEIMFDPVPEVYLPACDYIEFYNRYDKKISLLGWTVIVNGKTYNIGSIELESGEFMIFSSDNNNCVYEGVKTCQLAVSASIIPNSGGLIRLIDNYGRQIHFVEVNTMEKYQKNKSDGGWSLERIDPDNLCGANENWAVSTNWRGGTPGKANSVAGSLQDKEPPGIKYIGLPEENKLNVCFGEPVFLNTNHTGQFRLDNNPLVNELNYNVSNSVEFQTRETLLYNHDYNLIISDISDCSGNTVVQLKREFQKARIPESDLIHINEVMYDPLDEGNEYIELYNCSTSYFDLFDLKLSVSGIGSGEAKSIPVSKDSHLFPPGGFVILCKDCDALIDEWQIEKEVDIVGLDDWKLLSNSGGIIQLRDKAERMIDYLCYTDSLHASTLRITRGVSLERITQNECLIQSQCWTSAAASADFGTPGRQNSQCSDGQENVKGVFITPKVFSPDLDGFEDFLTISIQDIGRGALIDIVITDMSGNTVRNLISLGLGSVLDRFFWDGKDENNNIVLPGVYIVHIKISEAEKFKIYHEACGVRYR